MDLRYLKKGQADSVPSEVRSAVISFLEKVFQSQAETLPDVRDDCADESADVLVKEFVLNPGLEDLAEDPYIDAISDAQRQPSVPKLRKLRKFFVCG